LRLQLLEHFYFSDSDPLFLPKRFYPTCMIVVLNIVIWQVDKIREHKSASIE
jgi:hypothetical protein